MGKITSNDLSYLLHTHEITGKDSNNKYEDLEISDKTVDDDLVLINKSYSFNLTFANCTFEEVVHIDMVNIGHLHFDNCQFLKSLHIRHMEATSLDFDNCTTAKNVSFDTSKITFLEINKFEALNGINFLSGEYHYLNIQPLNEKTHFTFEGRFLLIDSLSLKSMSGITIFSKECIINSISVSGYYNIPSRLDFSNIINKTIHLENFNNDGKIYFSNIISTYSISHFQDQPIKNYLDKFSNSSNRNRYREIEFLNNLDDVDTVIQLLSRDLPVFQFKSFIQENHYEDFFVYKEYIRPNLNIENSSIGILEVKNVNFEFYTIKVLNSDLSSIKLINAMIPDLKINKSYLNYYNVYNELYSAASKQNNTKDKIEYYRISQRYLFLYFKKEAPKRSRDKGSRIAINISRLFSDHGTNWLQAIKVTVLLTFLFFCLFISSLKQITFELSTEAVNTFVNFTLRYFPQFLNPLHKIDFMDEISLNGLYSGIVDLVARIIISIGIFEIIRSFRKHVRQ